MITVKNPRLQFLKPLILMVFTYYLFFCIDTLQAQNHEINFVQTKWKEVLLKSKKEKKLVFLDCYTSWCGPCFWMKKNVFVNDSVADFYNKNFIPVKMDMEKGEGLELAKTYKINSYPTFLYLNEKGEILHRSSGSADVQPFIETGKNALNPEKQLATQTKRFYENPTDELIAYEYFKTLKEVELLSDSIIRNYFSRQKVENLSSSYNWKIIYNYSNYYSKEFKYLIANKPQFAQLYGNDSVEIKIEKTYQKELEKIFHNQDWRRWKLIQAEFRKLGTKNCERIIEKAEVTLVKLPNDNVKNAMNINDPVLGPVNVSDNRYAWFKFMPAHDTILTFDIVPNDSIDDYDFSVYRCSNKNCVDSMSLRKIQPLRSCRSYCTSKSGVTGLSVYTPSVSIGIGPGPAYVYAIPVKAGEVYYLEVYAQYTNVSGFTIYLYNYWPKKKPIVLENIFFESNKAVLLKESFPELDKLIVMLQKSNQMKLEIRGHTDNEGSESKNQQLSEDRAKAVLDYLVSKNINNDRLFYKGFGSKSPIAANTSDESRQKNRRVEFAIVMY